MQYNNYAIIKIGGRVEAEVLALDLSAAYQVAELTFSNDYYVLRYHTNLSGDLYFINAAISYN